MRLLAISILAGLCCAGESAAQVRVLYVYGTHPPALNGETLRLDDPGTFGYLRFRQALEAAGFSLDEFEAGPASSGVLSASLLDDYCAIILSSNNRPFSPAEATVVANWVNGGGGLVAWSDAAFGRDQNGDGNADANNAAANTGIPNTIGRDSDNSLTAQFGIQFLRDSANGVYDAGLAADDYQFDHFLWTNDPDDGVVRFQGEGVSPMKITGPAQVLLRLSDTIRSGGSQPPALNPADVADGVVLDDTIAALAVAEVGLGRVAGAFDRNTFFNPPGVGSNIDRFDNELFAQNLVIWAANAPGAVPLPGDYNADGKVDVADYTVWRDSLGDSGTGLAADGNGDRSVNAADFVIWKENFGTIWPDGALSASAIDIPESPTIVLLVIGFVLVAANWRKSSNLQSAPHLVATASSPSPCRGSRPPRGARRRRCRA